jgi:hypothetical protein
MGFSSRDAPTSCTGGRASVRSQKVNVWRKELKEEWVML